VKSRSSPWLLAAALIVLEGAFVGGWWPWGGVRYLFVGYFAIVGWDLPSDRLAWYGLGGGLSLDLLHADTGFTAIKLAVCAILLLIVVRQRGMVPAPGRLLAWLAVWAGLKAYAGLAVLPGRPAAGVWLVTATTTLLELAFYHWSISRFYSRSITGKLGLRGLR
jgi:hypothetical protein